MGLLDITFGSSAEFPEDATIIEITDGEAELVPSRRARARRAATRVVAVVGLLAAGAAVAGYIARRRADRSEEIDVEVEAAPAE